MFTAVLLSSMCAGSIALLSFMSNFIVHQKVHSLAFVLVAGVGHVVPFYIPSPVFFQTVWSHVERL